MGMPPGVEKQAESAAGGEASASPQTTEGSRCRALFSFFFMKRLPTLRPTVIYECRLKDSLMFTSLRAHEKCLPRRSVSDILKASKFGAPQLTRKASWKTPAASTDGSTATGSAMGRPMEGSTGGPAGGPIGPSGTRASPEEGGKGAADAAKTTPVRPSPFRCPTEATTNPQTHPLPTTQHHPAEYCSKDIDWSAVPSGRRDTILLSIGLSSRKRYR